MRPKKTKKKVVVFGGGNGSAVVLAALKRFSDDWDITGIVGMSDSGGSSGRLRREYGILPPGDILRAVLSLSPYPYPMLRDVFHRHRFAASGKMAGHNLGNLFFLQATQMSGSFLKAIEYLSTAVGARGRVLPASLDDVELCARLNNGKIIRGEAKIDKPSYPRQWKIDEVFLRPDGVAYLDAIKAIKRADYVIFAPGSLYTSVIAALLPRGLQSALARSKAKFIYACGNGYRADSETGPTKLSEFVSVLEKYILRPLDLVLYNHHQLDSRQKAKYRAHKWGLMKLDFDKIKNRRVVGGDYERDEGGLCDVRLGDLLRKYIK